jgi:hypothetical protein
MGDIPDCLKSDQTTSDLIRTDFHDIDLAGNPNLISKEHEGYHIQRLTEERLCLHHCKAWRRPMVLEVSTPCHYE